MPNDRSRNADVRMRFSSEWGLKIVDEGRLLLESRLEVDGVRNLGQHFVGLDLVGLNGFQHVGIAGETQNLRPVPQRAIYSDLVVFYLLCAADDSDIANGRVSCIFNGVGSFGCQAVNCLTGFG